MKDKLLKINSYTSRLYISIHRLVTLLLVLLLCIWFNPIKVLILFIILEVLEVIITFIYTYKWLKKKNK
jgi:putative flippase GtrA